MKVKDILYALPRHTDASGYDVSFVKVDENERKVHWQKIDTYNYVLGREELDILLLDAAVVSIESGRLRPGGHVNEELHVYVKFQGGGCDEQE